MKYFINCNIFLIFFQVIVYPLNPSRSTTNMRSRLMILFIWIYSLPFCVIPFFEAFGVGGYIPEGFLTACSYDYLDTSPENYYFIFIYAIVSYCNFFRLKAPINVLAGRVFSASAYHRVLLHTHFESCKTEDTETIFLPFNIHF